MSDECCGGADEPRAPQRVPAATLALTPTQATDTGTDACCAPAPTPQGRRWAVRPASDVAQSAAAPPLADTDACCGPEPARAPHDEDDESEAPRPPWWRDLALAPSAGAGVLLLVGFVLERLAAPQPVVLVAQVVALGLGAWTFVPGALRRLARGRLGVGLLMTIAAVGAVALGHVGEAAALAFLFSLAEALEDRAMDRAKEGLRGLLDLIPATARVRRPGGDATIPARDLVAGDLLVVAAGERVSTDAVVIEGRSGLDTAAVTGESIPVEVGPGDEAPAGSINGNGALLVRATGVSDSLCKGSLHLEGETLWAWRR